MTMCPWKGADLHGHMVIAAVKYAAAKLGRIPVHHAIQTDCDEARDTATLAAQVCVALGGDREYYAHEARVKSIEPASQDLLNTADDADIEEFKAQYDRVVSNEMAPARAELAALQRQKASARRAGNRELYKELSDKASAMKAELEAASPENRIKALCTGYQHHIFCDAAHDVLSH